MGQLISMGPCIFCNSGHNSPCFAQYDDGYCCFSCGKKKIGNYSYKPKTVLESNSSVKLPDNVSFNVQDFTSDVKQWLYKYYVSDESIRKYKLGCCSDNSLVLPVLDDNNNLSFYQQRFFPHKGFLTRGRKCPTILRGGGKCCTLVIVEDYISAIRVAEVVDSMCLFGTSCQFTQLKNVFHKYKNVVIWLDSDEAGQSSAASIVEQLSSVLRRFGFRVDFAVTNICNKQPKECTKSEIQQIVEGNNELRITQNGCQGRD